MPYLGQEVPGAKPARIIIETHQVGWRMTIEDEHGNTLDGTLSSSRWLLWRMTKLSWRRLEREWKMATRRADRAS